MEYLKEFMQPWMKKCNPQLIIRFWRSKGSHGKLTVKLFEAYYIFIGTPYGELLIKDRFKI